MAEAATRLPIKTEKPGTPAHGDWTSLEGLRREVDRLFDDFRPFGWHLPMRRHGFEMEMPFATRGFAVDPAFDVVEKDREYEITAELPGIDEKNVDIRLANQLLTVRGEKSEEKEEKEKDYYLSERRYGSFQRSFQVPDGIDADGIEAAFAKGVLTIRLPKSADAKRAEKKISVKAA